VGYDDGEFSGATKDWPALKRLLTDVAYALARAYNDWVIDFCKAAPDRLFAAAILPLQNMDFALEELARVAGIPSIRAVFIRPMFLEDRCLNHPYYDPLWAE
jgi:predicted TIM-barrel fold metal-dependent hydrolase